MPQRALADAGPALGRQKPGPYSKPKRIGKAELYPRIRHDAETEHLSIRALVGRHHVAWRTVKAALTIAFLREDRKDAAEIQQIRANTIGQMANAGYDPDW